LNSDMTDSVRSRREFLAAATGCVAHVLLNASCAPRGRQAAWTAPANPTVATMPFGRLEAIGADTWALISTPLGGDRTTFANGGIIAGRSGVVVIEGFYRPAGAQWLAEQARSLTGRWPTHVVLTHYHVDHASGVPGYAVAGHAAPRLHVTASTRANAIGGGPVAPARDAAVERAFADVVVVSAERTTRIDLGNRTVTLQPFRGHTTSDLTIHDDEARLTFTGDLVWYGMFPNFVDATPTAWTQSVRTIAARAAASARQVVVPGHGALISAAGMANYIGLLESLEQAARAGHGAGLPATEVASRYVVPSALGEWMASKPSVERAMTAWYRELGAR
jgi:glyoxylase-like metal-dependent hydrolase (beta-lactamase superfamily II)